MASWSETTTYEQLMAMTPAERTAHFQASIVLDASQLSEAEQAQFARLQVAMDERERQWAADAEAHRAS